MQAYLLYDEFIADKKIALVSPKTINFYEDSVYRWLEWCEKQKRYDRSDADALQRWAKLYMLSLVERQLSPYTIHTYGRGIRTFLKWAIAEEYMAGPYKFACPPKPQKDIRPLDLGAARDALAQVANQDTLVGFRNTVIVRTFVDTGLRLSELVDMELGDLDLEARSIRVKGKGQKVRFVYPSLPTVKALRAYLAQREDIVGKVHARVWVGEKGEPIGLRAVQSFMSRLKKRIKYEGKLSPHILRHTYAILFLEKGGNLASLQGLMGHVDAETTMEYANFSRHQDQRIATRFSPGSDL
tara:strand:- start:972 stop:1865 length:894 start_codon:yes stop_codon:yes gene_type:complete